MSELNRHIEVKHTRQTSRTSDIIWLDSSTAVYCGKLYKAT